MSIEVTTKGFLLAATDIDGDTLFVQPTRGAAPGSVIGYSFWTESTGDHEEGPSVVLPRSEAKELVTKLYELIVGE